MSQTESSRPKFLAGLTPVSFAATIFAMFVMAVMIQYAEVILAMSAPAEIALALPAITAILILLGIRAGLSKIRMNVLTRAQVLCVLYALLMSAPLMTQGFWHRALAVIATIPRTSDFARIDAYPEKLWPQGGNLVEGLLNKNGAENLELQGTAELVTLDVGKGDLLPGVKLQNASPEDESLVTLVLKSRAAGGGFTPGEPHLLSFLVRGKDITADSRYFLRLDAGLGSPQNVISSRTFGEKTWLQQEGFLRAGMYGVKLPASVNGELKLSVGLLGAGTVEIADVRVVSVDAIQTAYAGRPVVSQSEYLLLEEEAKAGLTVRPDHLLSLAGLKFILGGYIPWGQWIEPLAAWTGFIFLILGGTFALNVIMRRKWIENERYPLPLAKIPLALSEVQESEVPWYKNSLVWAGFAVALVWGLLKGWHFYNPAVPDTDINIQLADYFGPTWGAMWQGVEFRVYASMLALAIFFEINVLASMLVGFLLYRALFYLGSVTGWSVHPGFPYAQEQQLGGFAVYTFLVVVFSWRYLAGVFRMAVSGKKPEGEHFSYRSAMLLLAAIAFGAFLWAKWVGIPFGAVFLFLAFLLVIGFVCSKLRAECGLPFGYFSPYNGAIILLLLGGIPVFGAEAVLFAFVASFFLTVSVFFLIPGAQLELIELGRQFKINPRHLAAVCVIAILGGMVIGGWVFLSNSYSLGGSTIRYNWSYDPKAWYFTDFNQELNRATNTLHTTGDGEESGFALSNFGYIYGAVTTAVVTVLRQFFGGFWFHPVGFLLGPSYMLAYGWGSIAAALVLRWLFLKFGGAGAVKNRLQPFAIGTFIGAAVVYTFWVVVSGVISAAGNNVFYQDLP